MKRPARGDVAIAALTAVMAAFYIWIAYDATVAAQAPVPPPTWVAEQGVIVVAWVHAAVAVALVGAACYLRAYPIVCSAAILVLLGVWSAASISVLPVNMGYPLVLLLAPWALYWVARAPSVSQRAAVIVGVVASIGSLISPLMWRLADNGGIAYRGGDDRYTWLALHWVTVLALVLLGLRRKALEVARQDAIVRSREREHLRIASEIHDVLAHSLTLIRMQAAAGMYDEKAAKTSLETIHKVAGEGIAEVRMIVNALRSGNVDVPHTLHLHDVVERFRAAGLYIAEDVRVDLRTYSPIVQLALHRILTETLTNALKHQGVGTRVRLSVEEREQRIELRASSRVISTTSQRYPTSGGFGLEGIKERCVALGGGFEFDLKHNVATTYAWLPKDPQ